MTKGNCPDYGVRKCIAWKTVDKLEDMIVDERLYNHFCLENFKACPLFKTGLNDLFRLL